MPDAPRPALGELARRATAVMEARADLEAHPASFDALDRLTKAERDLRYACTTESILQLVALASGGADADWRSLSITAIAAENASVHEYVAALEARIAAAESDVAIVGQEAPSPHPVRPHTPGWGGDL
jgi:hypothetical protein